MYMDDKWTAFSTNDLEILVGALGKIGCKYPIDANTTFADQRPLPFYESVSFIRLKDPAWEPKNLFIYYLVHGQELIWLDGTSPPLHKLHEKKVLRLTQTTVLDYLRFFCFFVRSDEGPFVIVDDVSDTYVPKDVSESTQVVLNSTIRPANCDGQDADGNWVCDVTLYYANAIFIANFLVKPDGAIDMTNDQPIAADLPVKVDAPIA